MQRENPGSMGQNRSSPVSPGSNGALREAMLEAPNWYARKYNSVVARTRESDPDAAFHIQQIGAQRHESRLATIDHGDAFVLHLQDKGGIAMSGAINDDALTAVFLWGEGTTFNGQQ